MGVLKLIKNKLTFLLITIGTASFFLSYALVKQNYYIFFILIGVISWIILVRSDIFSISLILFIIPFTEWAVNSSYFPMQVMWLPELVSLLIFIKAILNRVIKKTKVNLFGIKVVLLFLVVSFVSLLLNGTSYISWILFLRMLFRYYLFFLAIINLDLDEKSMKLINNVLIFIFIVQIPLSVLKLFVFGQGETPLGLNSHSETTIIPLIAIGFLLSFYFIYQRRFILLLGVIGFIGFCIIGEKRAFIFFIPMVVAYFFWILKDHYKIEFKYLLIGIIVVIVSTYFSARLIPTLNPQREIGGKFSVVHLVNYAFNYSINYSEDGTSTGRLSTTIAVFNKLSENGLGRFFFGYGPGSILKSMFQAFNRRRDIYLEFGVQYGDNGLTWLGIQVGYVGAGLFFLLLSIIWRKARFYFEVEKDPYWRSFALGMTVFAFTMLLLSIVYTPFFTTDSISAFYFCMAGIVVSRSKMLDEKNTISL